MLPRGTTFTATVWAADEFFNPYEPTQGQVPDAWIELNTPYANTGTTITLSQATTTFDVVIFEASTTTVITANTNTIPFVKNSTMVSISPARVTLGAWSLQLLLPGMNADPGSASGSTGAPIIFQATTPYSLRVNLVDTFHNVL